jgi:hypothetical protein
VTRGAGQGTRWLAGGAWQRAGPVSIGSVWINGSGPVRK